MLTPDDLTIIRAALRFFYDELLPHGPKAIAPYLDDPLNKEALTTRHITQLCNQLTHRHIRWASYSHENGKLLDGKLLPSIEEVNPNQHLHLATVLLPSRR